MIQVPVTTEYTEALCPLGNGDWSLVDEELYRTQRRAWFRDGGFLIVKPWRVKWHVITTGACTYAVGKHHEHDPQNRMLFLHRVLSEAGPNEVVDHWDRNGLNNRSYNLRVCSMSDNAGNKAMPHLKGVSRYRGGGYRATAVRHGRQHALGIFQTPEEAALAYDDAARELFGEFARTNFDTEAPVLVSSRYSEPDADLDVELSPRDY